MTGKFRLVANTLKPKTAAEKLYEVNDVVDELVDLTKSYAKLRAKISKITTAKVLGIRFFVHSHSNPLSALSPINLVFDVQPVDGEIPSSVMQKLEVECEKLGLHPIEWEPDDENKLSISITSI